MPANATVVADLGYRLLTRAAPVPVTDMRLPFTKAQAVGNDFLVVESAELEQVGLTLDDAPSLAREICNIHSGVGADGLEIVLPSEGAAAAHLRIFNSDGSEAEISGNGTRCVAAYLVEAGRVGEEFQLSTAAGTKVIHLLKDNRPEFEFLMGMGTPSYDEDDLDATLELADGPRTVTILDVGNPQCVLFVDDFDLDWRGLGNEIESHPQFPARTNVSFVRVVDERTIDVRFWERGAGETLSSGTGSSGAVAASILTKRTGRQVEVRTPAGNMNLRWDDGIQLQGPATLIAKGEYFT